MLSFLARRCRTLGPRFSQDHHFKASVQRIREIMAERPVLVGVIPQVVVLDDGDQIAWLSDAGNLRVEFDANRCPFSSNVFQAPAGMRLLSGRTIAGTKPGSFHSRL